MKGENFNKLQIWYDILFRNFDIIVNLLENESDDPNAISNSLGVLKCGLFSYDSKVANLCC